MIEKDKTFAENIQKEGERRDPHFGFLVWLLSLSDWIQPGNIQILNSIWPVFFIFFGVVKYILVLFDRKKKFWFYFMLFLKKS